MKGKGKDPEPQDPKKLAHQREVVEEELTEALVKKHGFNSPKHSPRSAKLGKAKWN